MKKLLYTTIATFVVLTMVLSLWACKGTEPTPDTSKNETPQVYAEAKTIAETYAAAVHDVPTISDYTVPADFDLNTIRLEIWTPETGWTADLANAPFDETRPTIIHSHGQGRNGYMFTPQALYNGGYNVISFLWGCMSDDELEPIEQKIWQRIEKYVRYDVDGSGVEHSVYVKTTEFDCTVPELYVARYCDFFALHPDYNMPIRLTGHSYGGQLNFALASYMTTLFLEGRLPARLLPERYTLLDPYFDNLPMDFECRWLGETIHFSSVGAAIYCIDKILAPNNVAIEMLRTSPLVELATIMGVADDDAPDYFVDLKPLFRVTELKNVNELREQFDDMTVGMGFWHTIANDFYFSPQAKELYYDAASELIFGRETPAEFVLATRGMHFDLWVDEVDYAQYQNVRVARTVTDAETDDVCILAGLVTRDADGDGVADEKAAERLIGASVVLTDDATGEKQTYSTVNGFYRFDVLRDHTYTLQVHAGGYASSEVVKVSTAQSFCTTRNFSLAKQ